MCKDIWVGLQQLYPNDICYSKETQKSYQFFRGFKVIKNTDNTVQVYDTHISEYYTDKYGIQRITQYPLVTSVKILNKLKDAIYVEISNNQNILSS